MARDQVSTYRSYARNAYYLWEDGSITNFQVLTKNSIAVNGHRGNLVKSNHVLSTNYTASSYAMSPNHFKWLSKSYSGRLDGVRMTYQFVEEGFEPSPTALDGLAGANLMPSWLSPSARTRVLSKLTAQDVNVGNLLGELPSSLRMIGSHSIAVLRAYRALRRGNYSQIPKLLGVRKVKDLPGSAADVWFAYKFGWEPLITDTYNLHSAVMKQLNRPAFTRVKAVSTTESSDLATVWKVTKGNLLFGVEVGVAYKVDNEFLAGLNGLGLTNPVSIAWELLPLSFVVDWFIPIGSFLEALSAPLGLKFVTGYETSFIKGDLVLEAPDDAFYIQGTNPSQSVKTFDMDRNVLSSWPLPSIFIPKIGINRNQFLTLTGLLAQRAR